MTGSLDIDQDPLLEWLRRIARSGVAGRCPTSDADVVARVVAAHGLGQFVEAALADGTAHASADVAHVVAAHARRERQRRAMLDLELTRLGSAVSESSLPRPLLIKGPAVASLYADPRMRTYVDIDLLVPADNREDWIRELAALGYSPSVTEEQRTPAAYHATTLQRRAGSTTIVCDLHVRLSTARDERHVRYEQFAHGTTHGGIAAPPPVHLAVILALCLQHHPRRHRRLIWLRDFIELDRHGVLQEAQEVARDLQVDRAMQRTLWQAQALIGEARWNARPVMPPRGSLAHALETDDIGYRTMLATARELGLREGIAYAAARFGEGRRRHRGNGMRDFVGWGARIISGLAGRKPEK